jgi:Big-like domain-containing protein
VPSARRLLARAALLLVLAAGCARKLPPSGGPPDLEPPVVLSVIPDSGATAVDRTGHLTVEFSEAMDPRSASLAVEIAPTVEVKTRHWSGRKLVLVLADSLRANQTYTLFVGTDARDQHGNTLRSGRAVPFTTALEFPPGLIAGDVVATGFPAPGTYLWCYPEGKKPDSTARDFEAVGLAGEGGAFRVTGLHVPGRYQLWAFADLNHNHSFEPEHDLLVAADTTLALTASQPVASGFELHVVNPRAPGSVKGTVLDSLADTRGTLRLIVASVSDTTRRLLYDLDPGGAYDFKWDPGVYRVRAFRDLDRNKTWTRDEEPASDEIEAHVRPGGSLELPTLVLVRPSRRAGSP